MLLIVVLFSVPVVGATPPVVAVLGDSISAAYGIAPDQGWVALLAQRLRDEGYPHGVVNASISGDTTAGGLARLDGLLQREQPAVLIIELGGNDGLRGLPIKGMRENLARMVARATASGSRVLLAGMRIPPNYGPRYSELFHTTFRQLSVSEQVGLVPFLLDGIADVRHLMQADNIHPTAEAQPLILDNLWPQLVPLLQQREGKDS